MDRGWVLVAVGCGGWVRRVGEVLVLGDLRVLAACGVGVRAGGRGASRIVLSTGPAMGKCTRRAGGASSCHIQLSMRGTAGRHA